MKSASGGPWTFGLGLKLWICLSGGLTHTSKERFHKLTSMDIKVTVSRFSIERLELAKHWTHPWPANTSRWENMNQWSAGGRRETTLITFQMKNTLQNWSGQILSCGSRNGIMNGKEEEPLRRLERFTETMKNELLQRDVMFN